MDVFSSRSFAHRALVAIAAFALTWTVQASTAHAQDAGEAKFKEVCAACHTIGGGVRVGPDLAGVTERRDEAWLIAFIKDSGAVIKSGDPVATKLFKEFKNMPMPPNPISDAEIKAVLAYIESAGGGAAAAPAAPLEVTPESIALGAALFQGHKRFQNGGAPCNSCHDVTNDAVIGGGVLAADLTTVFSRMGAPGVEAILGKPPFPVMDAAYADHPLTPEEVHGLVSFLQDADKNHQLQTPRDFGGRLFLSGTVVFVVLMGLYALMWRRRKKHSVNQDIYDRQIKTF